MPIAIDTAGLHPTTEACLKALQQLHEHEQFSNILEIGCGNGILSLAAASIWDARVLAADISEKAVNDTIKSIREYGLEERVEVVRSDGFSHPEIALNAPYDLIICNLLADTILQLANSIKKSLKSNGYCIISGILAWRAEEVSTVIRGLNIDIIEENQFLSWQSYTLRNTTET